MPKRNCGKICRLEYVVCNVLGSVRVILCQVHYIELEHGLGIGPLDTCHTGSRRSSASLIGIAKAF